MRLFAAIILSLVLTGCGYQFAGRNDSLPGGVQSVHLALFANQTAEPQLENLLANRVSEVFARSSSISQLENAELAEAVLSGEIRSYGSSAISYNQNDDISEYRVSMVVAARLRQVADGRALWQGTLNWSSEYPAADNKTLQEDLEQMAADEICLRLAEELHSRLTNNF